MSSDEVIELSIEETQALRAKLGLAPLRGVSSGTNNTINNNSSNNSSDEISLSIEETNALRVKIGLPPLKQSSTQEDATKKREGSSVSTAIHAPPTNTAAELEARSRIEDALAKRDAKERIQRLEEENRKHNSGKDESALSFASRMMKGSDGSSINNNNNNNNNTEKDRKKKKMKKKGIIKTNAQLSIPTDEEEQNNNDYSSADLQGIKVSHATSDFTAGSTTILTLADKSILDVDPNSRKVRGFDANADEHELINVNMDDDTRALENLKRKRQIELGAGRAGGYAGYDDDEFEELGGVGVASSSLAGAAAAAARGSGGTMSHNNGKQKRGFAIGADGMAKSSNEKDTESNLFSTLSGGAVSLESRYGNTIASDFISYDKDNEMESKEEKLEKERAKQMKMLEKMRKKNKKKMKKDKRKKQKRVHSDDDDDESDNDQEDARGGGMDVGNSLMASLEATAVDVKSDGNGRKRRRHDDNEDGDQKSDTTDTDEITAKKKKFELIMQKGKERTDKAFQNTTAKSSEMEDTADDDAFLNAALAKARRLKRLKEMNGGATSKTAKGEAVVINAVEKIKQEEAAAAIANAKDNGAETTKTAGGGGLTFEFDEMQEFTRALRAREDQAKRAAPVRSRGVKATASTNKKEIVVKKEEEIIDDTTAEPMVEDVDMEEMAQEMIDDSNNNDDDDNHAAFGSTAENTGVGRGMAGFLSLLKQTGEIKNSGKEEMRGRAKDKRTYEDYDNLDLKKIVKIDTRNAQEKDIEFANREIKLEYRDDHGRLLTRKEAYRNMCYQFHGHGSSKKNEERRQKQIEREREEQKLASRQVNGVGTLGALKATQKATGKAFIVHKT